MVEPLFEPIRSLTDHAVCTRIMDLSNGESSIGQTFDTLACGKGVDTSRPMVIHESEHFGDWYDL
jgi:hypothetical protein